ncbi:MAG TPA: hypothetical protein VKS79_02590 [Gemmataceae bacterium]|nr:hypothetical protein [Gemmataceae bacterium]
MKHLLIISIFAMGLTTFPLRADDNQPPQDQAQPEVLGRGPIHEAYAQPYDANATPGEVVPKKPPDPIPEQPPDVKPDGKNVQWIPGYWQWDTTKNDYIWVSGFWRDVPEGRRWVPGYWTQASGGWQWVSGHWAGAREQDFQYVPQPPPQSLDQGPSTPAPDDQSVYVPGNWVYDTSGYAWQPGYWSAYQPGSTWVPASYFWTPLGYSYCSGYWDYDFCNRGLLFAPVYFGPTFPFYNGYCFRPFYSCFFNPFFANRFGFGFDSLFVHPGFHHFFFGDFFGNHFAHAGFHPWGDFASRHFDPIFAHERIAHRGDPQWFNDLHGRINGRANGTLPNFPHTLAAQQALGAHGGNVHPGLTSLTQLQHSGVNLQNVSAAQIRAQTQQAQQLTQQSQHWTHNGGPVNSRTPQTAGFNNGIGGHPGISTTAHSFTTPGSSTPGIHATTPNNNVPRTQSPLSNERFPQMQTTRPNSFPRTQSPLSNERFPQMQTTTPNNSFPRVQTTTPNTTVPRIQTTPNMNFPNVHTTTPNLNVPHTQSLTTPHWTGSPNTNLNQGWNRPQTFTPNNVTVPRTQNFSPNWNSAPRTNFSNPGTTRMPATNFQNHFSMPNSQSFSRANFTPQSTYHPSMSMPTYHPSMNTTPHFSGGSYHPSSGGSYHPSSSGSGGQHHH